MFKKSGIGLVVLLYLMTATGFSMNLHFCGKSIESVRINAPAKDCGMSSKCCKETHVDVKVKDAHQSSHTSFNAEIFSLPVVSSGFVFQPEFSTINSSFDVASQRGPPHLPVSIFLKNCTFRI